uniref:Uncharacterized protein n=1 Tax=Meloidogyne enterolobii TaxID=390850 RepID=A0A6V7WVP3_MELEN|nr:unnamed protein product [Meloidogyne enterolobii]
MAESGFCRIPKKYLMLLGTIILILAIGFSVWVLKRSKLMETFDLDLVERTAKTSAMEVVSNQTMAALGVVIMLFCFLASQFSWLSISLKRQWEKR